MIITVNMNKTLNPQFKTCLEHADRLFRVSGRLGNSRSPGNTLVSRIFDGIWILVDFIQQMS